MYGTASREVQSYGVSRAFVHMRVNDSRFTSGQLIYRVRRIKIVLFKHQESTVANKELESYVAGKLGSAEQFD